MRTIFCSITAFTISLYINPLTFAIAEGQLPLSPGSNSSVNDTYPHISALENAILGQSYSAQPLTERLSRMEKKAFGNASADPDLSARTDALDDYTDKQLHKKLLQANTDADTNQDSNSYNNTDTTYLNDDQSVQNQADYPHVTSLEQSILGQTFAGQPLAERLSRMEVKAFGNASTNTDLSARTDALEAYAEKTLHKQPSINTAYDSNDESATARNNSQSSGLLSKVGHTLLSMAAGPALGGMGSPMGFGGGGMGGGFGNGGMGRGYSGNGMGRGMSNRQAAQQQPEPPPVKEDDPAVYQATPPDTNARLIIKVGWCEVKVFGHTFPDMHLTARLGQLNKELHLEPGKSNIQLMDDIGLMIKAVQARK